MRTKVIEGKSPRADDQEIVDAAEKAAAGGAGLGGGPMCIGIRNEAGQIYRAISTEGMGEFMDVIGALLDRGLVDELKDSYEMREGCDAIFR